MSEMLSNVPAQYVELARKFDFIIIYRHQTDEYTIEFKSRTKGKAPKIYKDMADVKNRIYLNVYLNDELDIDRLLAGLYVYRKLNYVSADDNETETPTSEGS